MKTYGFNIWDQTGFGTWVKDRGVQLYLDKFVPHVVVNTVVVAFTIALITLWKLQLRIRNIYVW